MKKFSQATPRERAQYIANRWETLKTKRQPWLDQWRSVADYISPFSGRFDVHDHGEDRNFSFIYDSEAGYDLNILSSGLMTGASSPARPWFKIAPNDPDLVEDYSVINWCDAVQKILLKIFQDSNTYNTLHQMYKELALFGIAADLVYEDPTHGIRHHLLTAGEYCVETNANDEIDTLYRNFELTTTQAVKAFGYDALPHEIQQAYDNGELSTYWEFLHAIEPRTDRDLSSKTNKNFPWASYYIAVGTSKSEFVRESGFEYFPVICPRWEVLGSDPYGFSPAMTALPDIRQLQQETLRKAELIDLLARPPLQVPNAARQSPVSIAPNAKNFTSSTSQETLIKPIVAPVNIDPITQDIERIKQAIRRSFFVDLFMMVQQTAGDRRTTVEISALQQEQMLSLGSVVERNQNECLGKLVNIAYRRLLSANVLPPLPERLKDKQLNIEYTSVLAQAQKSVDINAVDRLVSALSAAAQVAPEVLDRIDPDGYVDEYRDRLGVAPKILRSKEDADKIRQARAQQQQQQAEQMQQSQGIADAQQLAQAQKTGADASLAMQKLDDVGIGGGGYV